MAIELHGYKYSVYTWIARACLHQKGIAYETIEVDPFSLDLSSDYLILNPFGNVPTLIHDGFTIYESRAITTYLDSTFEGERLTPTDTRALSRMNQIISIIDSYGYWPMIRQVFSQRVFAPALGEDTNEDEIRIGLAGSEKVLQALNAIADEGLQLNGDQFTLSDIHLAPMVSYFTMAPEGAALLKQFTALLNWWDTVQHKACFTSTRPDIT
ncbi:MAG: glutathione S-transferase family protein [Rhizobiaceae bacterium]